MSWPRTLTDGPVALPVVECNGPLRFQTPARNAPTSSDDVISAGLLAAVNGDPGATDEGPSAPKAPPVQWCHDSDLPDNQAIYRPNMSERTYLMTLGDSGRGLHVGTAPSLSQIIAALDEADGAKRAETFAIALHLPDRTINFRPQDRLPSPDRAAEVVNSGQVTVTTVTWGDERAIEISADILEE